MSELEIAVPGMSWFDEPPTDPHDEPDPGPAEPPPDEPALRLFETTGSADLLDPDPPLDWLIRGMLSDPTYGQLAGEMKTLKSYLATFLAVGVATGTRLFDRFDVDQARPVLMYVGEGGRRGHKARIRRVAQAMGVDLRDLADQLHRSYDVAPVSSANYQASLYRDLEAIRPGLFLLDPLYAYHGTDADSRNLHEEGAHLVGAVELARHAGATALIVNHFNQTGGGTGLKRITQAGSGEWVDSWILTSHRDTPDVTNGRFRLALEIGSRQWGGTSWDLDLDIGRFDPDTGHHDGDITWDLRRGGTSNLGETAARILTAITDHPGELAKEDAAKAGGGQLVAARRLVASLIDRHQIHPQLVEGTRSDGRRQTVWRLFPGPPPGTTHETTPEGTTHDDA